MIFDVILSNGNTMLKRFKNCQKITEWVSQSYDGSLSASQSMAVKSHLLICTNCRNFDKNNHLLKQLIAKHKTLNK